MKCICYTCAEKDCRFSTGVQLMVVFEKHAVWCSMTEEGFLFRLCISSNHEMLATLHACLKISSQQQYLGSKLKVSHHICTAIGSVLLLDA